MYVVTCDGKTKNASNALQAVQQLKSMMPIDAGDVLMQLTEDDQATCEYGFMKGRIVLQ